MSIVHLSQEESQEAAKVAQEQLNHLAEIRGNDPFKMAQVLVAMVVMFHENAAGKPEEVIEDFFKCCRQSLRGESLQ